SGVLAIASYPECPTLIGFPGALVPGMIGVTVPAQLLLTYTVTVPWCCLLVGGAPRSPVTAGMTTAITATAARPPAAPSTRRRRRLMPARNAFCATGPIDGSPASVLRSSLRSVVSSIAGAPWLVFFLRQAAVRDGLGHGLAQHYPQLAQGAGAEALHVARRTPQHVRHLLDAQVLRVAQHHHCPAPRR